MSLTTVSLDFFFVCTETAWVLLHLHVVLLKKKDQITIRPDPKSQKKRQQKRRQSKLVSQSKSARARALTLVRQTFGTF